MSDFNQDELPALSPALRDLQRSLRRHRFDAANQARPEISTAIRQLTVLIAAAEELEERLTGWGDEARPMRGGPRVASGADNVVQLTFHRGGPAGPDRPDGGRAA